MKFDTDIYGSQKMNTIMTSSEGPQTGQRFNLSSKISQHLLLTKVSKIIMLDGIVHFTLAHTPPAHTPDAECGVLTGRVTKIKNRCEDGAHHREECHFLMNGRLSLPPCPAFANVTLCKAICSEWQRSRQSYRPQHCLQILFIICCHKPEQGRQE